MKNKDEKKKDFDILLQALQHVTLDLVEIEDQAFHARAFYRKRTRGPKLCLRPAVSAALASVRAREADQQMFGYRISKGVTLGVFLIIGILNL